MTSEAIIRAAEASDFPRITALLQQFEHSESEAHYRWKFRQPPLGAVNVIAERDGRLVGHYGYIIREFLIDGRPARVGLGTDMLVDRGL
ncbi:MAG: GNAT family N-acetyltransferase, partial [Myxococcales bacterium]|nr:GNAT family N-acetyltransferase [Myxococcales bacterium]